MVKRYKGLALLIFCLSTVFFVYGLTVHMTMIQGLSPLQYAGNIPTTFIEGEMKVDITGEELHIINFQELGIGGYDVYKARIDSYDLARISSENFTENWSGWHLSENGISDHGVDAGDKIFGNYSLWFDVILSNLSNAWIRYGNEGQCIDLSPYNAMTVDIKFNASSQLQNASCRIQVGTGNRSDADYFEYDFNITDSWAGVLIPFSAFNVVGSPSLNDARYITIFIDTTRMSSSHRVWIDALSFLTNSPSFYLNGSRIIVDYNLSEIDDLWIWSDIYGRNPRSYDEYKMEVSLHGFTELELTMFIRLYPKIYLSRIESTNSSTILFESYEWTNLESLISNLSALRLMISLPDDVLNVKLNEYYIPLDYERTTIYLYEQRYPLGNVISLGIPREDNYSLDIYSNLPWFEVPFHFLRESLSPLVLFQGINYPLLVTWIVILVVQAWLILCHFLNKKPTKKKKG